jgi:predicted Zn-dependent peptidase
VLLEDIAIADQVLPTGLRVVVAPLPHLHRAHLALHVRVGARFETQATSGISHFLEHMLYRGTERLRSAHEVNRAFERLGSYLYGATHADFGVFSVTVPPECLPDAIALFGHVLTSPAFFDIDIEKGIVCEEILEDLDDDGRQVDADNISRALIYGTHPLGFTITGSEKTVKSFDVPMLRKHHARHYTTANAVLSMTGAVDPARALPLAAEHFGPFARGEAVPFDKPLPQKKPRLKIVENASSQTELRVCFRAPGRTDSIKPALELFMRIIDDGMSTRLYHRICDSQGLCYDVSAGYDGYEDDGVIDFAAGVVHERTAKVTKEILALVTELAKDGPTEDELAKAKQRHRWHMHSMLDETSEISELIALSALSGRGETPLTRARAATAVTRDDVVEAARLIADPKRLSVVAVGLLEREDEKQLEDAVKSFRWA